MKDHETPKLHSEKNMSHIHETEWKNLKQIETKTHACLPVCATTNRQTRTHTLTHTHTQEAVVQPLTGRWPDSPAAAGCLMFHSEDHISFPDSSTNRRKTESQWQREALLPLFTLCHSTTDQTLPSKPSKRVLYLNSCEGNSHVQVDSHTYSYLCTSHPGVQQWLRG